ncbi:conserved hypothetical protein [Tolumonas auensis DSM 9187]|jgi:uncharacterized protein (DUF2132 family)|uniref:Transporter n=1 Tax=Tolumonas auensis (strain DSM 9187 / NBRC 110442 / TA 4) TaxID=595494 RepID=C4LEQ1_TOLAT|nr:VF530 family protein [Tolumonas auensis]ACQ93068.1 conserved hypothetical protein [Tolumonas auensis DSM 9187]NCB57711.1 DUF2132 domain-containing protein [Gammaproteobacteria bacterium]
MTQFQSKDPLHGVTLERIVTELVEHYGWDVLGQRIDINCFQNEPSIKSSLKFLRRTPWARAKVEELYVITKSSPWAKKAPSGE